MKVSILMPVHNQIDFTKKAIESLYQFTDEKDFELFVVDNGSEKELIPYLQSLKVSNLLLIPLQINMGWCVALNKGFKGMSSDSDFVLWANNDIVFEKDWLPKMLAHFRPGIGAVGPTSNFVNGLQRIEANDGNWEEEVQWLIGFCLLFRRGVIDAIGEVDERYHMGGAEEFDYIIRMQQKLGLKCVIARDVYIHHFGSQTIRNTIAKTNEEYTNYCIDALKILSEKWGAEFIDKWIQQKINFQATPLKTAWPSNCLLGLAIPHTWSNIDYSTHLSLLALKKPNMIVLEAGRGGELDTKRERQIEDGFNKNCTHFLIGDGDMLFPSNILIDLFKVLEDGADMAGGLCYRGYPPYDPIAWHPTQDRMILPFIDYKFGDVIDAGAVGCACLLVKREVFEKLERPWFQNKWEKILTEEKEVSVDYEEGDYYFTRKATRAGFKLRLWTKYDVDHLREFPVNRKLWLIQGLLDRCGGWGTIVSLFKKLGDQKWIDREINNSSLEVDWKMNQSPYEIGLLYNFLQGKRIKDVLEIGTQGGGSALLWAKLVESRDGHVVSIDRASQTPKVYENHVLKDVIIEIEGDSHNQVTIQGVHDVISSNGGEIDFLFIDGDHTYQGVKADFEAYSSLVKKGGWIAFHDIADTEWHRSQNCRVSDFWEEIKQKYNHIEIVDPNDKKWMGIGLMEWKKS